MSRYDVILLDVGETLLFHSPQERSLAWSRILGAPVDTVESALRSAVSDHPLLSGNEPEPEHSAAWSRIFLRTLEAVGFAGDADAAVAAMRDVRVRLGWRPYPEVDGVLSAMRGIGYRLGVVSNWVATLEQTLGHVGLARHFETIACSAVVGTTKPDPRIFRHALNALDADPATALYVGDHYATDVLGARGVGMDAVLIARNGDGHVRDAGPNPPPTIRTLDEIWGALGGRP